MTAPRLARAGRSRFLVAIGILILMVGFVALFNSSQQQLDESNLLRLRCEQQHDALNSRLQAIVDHKFRLEKSLENERKEYLETKQNFELKAEQDKNQHAKQALDASVRFESSQQHNKILQSKHNDLVDSCAKNKKLQSEEINGLEGKLKLLQNQIKLAQTTKDKEIEEWKVKYENMAHENDRLEIILKATQSSDKCTRSENLLKDYKANCNYQPPGYIDESLPDTLQQSHNHNHQFTQEDPPAQEFKSIVVQKSFKEQELVSKNLYKIPITFTNKTQIAYNNSNLVNGNYNVDNLDSPINFINSINSKTNDNQRHKLGAIINSVENFQIAPKPLLSSNDQIPNIADGFQQPPPLNPPIRYLSSTKASGDLKLHDDYNKRDLPIASVASPSSAKYQISKSMSSSSSTTTPTNEIQGRISRLMKPKQLPKGVAPVPDNFEVLLKNDEHNRSEPPKHPETNSIGATNTGGDKKNSAGNNRYANVVNEFSNNGGGLLVSEKKDDEDNGAREIKDTDFNNGVDEKLGDKDQLQAVLENLNNAAEDDTNNFFDTKLLDQNKKDNEMDDDDVGDPPDNNHHKHNNHKNVGDDGDENKLINEVVGDQGKEQAFPDGMHLEEANEEDDDDYSNPAARKPEGQAIRN